MNPYKKKIIHSFNQADLYEQSAKIQKIVVKRLVSYLKNLDIDCNKSLSILEIGCGTGLLTQYLIKLFPNAQFVITDISPDMVERTRKKLGKKSHPIRFEVMDGEQPHLDNSFDLICSSLTFQWFEDLPQSLHKLTYLLNPNGYLLCSTLAKESFCEWRTIHNEYNYSCSLQSYPDITTLNTYWPSRIGGGFWEKEILIDSVKGIEFIRGLRAIGAHTPPITHTPLSAGQLYKVIKQFNTQYGYTTYEIALGCFRKFAGKGFFVTGTDTDIGKTFASACLTKALNAIYWKPIQTGLISDCGDTKTVQQLTNLPDEQVMAPCIELQEPLSPEAAAKREGILIDIRQLDLNLPSENKNYIVEGAGGIFVPVTDSQFMIQLMQKINLPVIIVARTGLGTLNHTLSTIEILRYYHIPIAGVILNGNSNPENKEAIERHGQIKVMAEIPKMETITPEFIAQFSKDIALFY